MAHGDDQAGRTCNDDTLDQAMQNSEQYYSAHEFIRSLYRFNLIPIKVDLSIRKDLNDTYDHDLGICDECQRTNDRCNCSTRWDRYDYDDDEYDRYHDR